MIDPKWHQSTIQRVPYTQLRSQRATVQNYIEDSVKSGINFFFFQFWSFESMILNQITGGITFANTRPLLLHFTINAFRQTPITKNRWTHQHIQTAFTYFKGKCPILIQHFSKDLSKLSQTNINSGTAVGTPKPKSFDIIPRIGLWTGFCAKRTLSHLFTAANSLLRKLEKYLHTFLKR